VLCGIAADGRAEIVEDGGVLIDAGRIVAIGTFAALAADHPECEVVGKNSDVVAPGFVNAHHHVGLTPFQGGVPDLPLELWIAAKIGLRAVDPYLDTLLSAFEMIASGVTTVQHLDVSRGDARAVASGAEAILAAYRDIGMRVSYSYAYRDQNRLVYEADETFLARLPSELAAELRPWFERQRIPLAEHLAQVDQLVGRYQGADGGRVAVQLAPANLHWCSDEAIGGLAAAADRHGVPLHMHLLETKYQREYAYRAFGESAVSHLMSLRVLGPRLTLGHAVWVEDDDYHLLAESGTCVCHNASSNMRLRSGLAPCCHFLKHGIPVAIGIDEAGINDDRDMLQELRMALKLHGSPGLDIDDVLTASDVFRMATEHGAQTTPFGSTIGRLATGAAADMVLFDWELVASPYLDDDVPLVDAIVHRAKAAAVRQVLIGGHTVYEDGAFTFVDRQAVLREIRARLAAPRSAQEVRRRDMARALLPYVRSVYDTER